AETVLWAAGVAASPFVGSLGAERDPAGRVLVQPDLTIPGHSEVFVIGDAAALTDAHGEPLPGGAPVAMQQGPYVARALAASGRDEPRAPFVYRDKGSLATIGRADAVAHIGRLNISGFPAWLLWTFVHILYLVGFRNRVIVLLDWAWAYLTMSRGARLI